MSGVAKNGNFMVDYGFRLMESMQLELRCKIKKKTCVSTDNSNFNWSNSKKLSINPMRESTALVVVLPPFLRRTEYSRHLMQIWKISLFLYGVFI
jgi:hypothetical protein